MWPITQGTTLLDARNEASQTAYRLVRRGPLASLGQAIAMLPLGEQEAPDLQVYFSLMGMGPDGHTASLFPGYPATKETERWVVGVPKANVEPFVPRVTLTFPALASCYEMLFEVSGASKRAILTRVLADDDLPAGRAHSSNETIWLVDRAALPENFGGR